MRQKKILVVLIALMLMVSFAGCGASAGGDGELKDVSLRLSWFVKGEFTHLLVAKELGYFEEEGLNVEIREGSEKVIPTQLLVNGEDDFAYIAASDMLIARDKGMDLIMAMCTLQKNPVGVMSFPDAGISSPADMVGKKIIDTAGGSLSSFWEPFLKTNNVDPDDVELIIADWGAKNTSLLNGEVDGVSAFATNELASLRVEEGKNFNFFAAADYGYNLMAHGIITSRDYYRDNPDVVEGMVRAVQRGMQYMRENPEEAARIAAELYPDNLEEAITLEQVKETIRYYHTPNSEGMPLGWVELEDLQSTADVLYESGALEKPVEDLESTFTNEFLDESVK